MPRILAMDAGGTSTRAVILDSTGHCLGYGRAGTGNPTAAGIDHAVEQLGLAAERAILASGSVDGVGLRPVISLAGSTSGPFAERLAARFALLGADSAPSLQPDLLGAYFSGTIAVDGTAMIAGTGAVAGRVVAGRLDDTRGGTGWLLGDEGSGFWIGHRVARAVVAELDGLGPTTALTGEVFELLGIEQRAGALRGRPVPLIDLMEALYALRPVDLARLAPTAFAVRGDEVADAILTEAATVLAALLAATRNAGDRGPIVLGGSILTVGMRTRPEIFETRLKDAAGGAVLVPVSDGVVGAAVLGLRQAGVRVDDELFSRLRGGAARVNAQNTEGTEMP